jgi:hypothetical protein
MNLPVNLLSGCVFAFVPGGGDDDDAGVNEFARGLQAGSLR